MFHQDSALQTLADRMCCGDAPPNRVRETLEASLTPLVRRALRSGAGIPQLVRWVQTTLPQIQAGQDRTRPVDPELAAPPLARLLCATLLGKRPTRPDVAIMDTIIGA
jgi:hypothetical protein